MVSTLAAVLRNYEESEAHKNKKSRKSSNSESQSDTNTSNESQKSARERNFLGENHSGLKGNKSACRL